MSRGSRGYRRQRLEQRRSERLQTWQSVTLYVLAGVVAFAAVLGAIVLSRHLGENSSPAPDAGYIALVRMGNDENGRGPVAGLLVYDRPNAELSFFVIPPTYLFSGPQGEYVMGEDVIASPDIDAFVERLLGVPVDHVVDLSYADLARLTNGSDVYVKLPRPVTAGSGDTAREYAGDFSLPSDALADVLNATVASGPDQALLEQAVLDATFKTAALQPADVRDAAVAAVAARQSRLPEDDVVSVLEALTGGRLVVERLPSRGVTAEGQFAYRPDPEQIMARVSRKSPRYDAPFTVVVENGSGEAGIAEMVAERLAVLDVDLPAVRNARSFDYAETQILAGSEAVGAAEDVRAILGHGVVLSGRNLAPDTVVVVVGKDLTEKDLR